MDENDGPDAEFAPPEAPALFPRGWWPDAWLLPRYRAQRETLREMARARGRLGLQAAETRLTAHGQVLMDRVAARLRGH